MCPLVKQVKYSFGEKVPVPPQWLMSQLFINQQIL